MKIRLAVPVFVALAIASIAGGQSAPKVSDGASGKVGIISVQDAVASTAEGKVRAADLQSKYTSQQRELQTIQKSVEDLQTKLQTGQNALSGDEKNRLQQQISALTLSGQHKQQALQDDVSADEQAVMYDIGRKLESVVAKYARGNGYSVILDASSQQTNVFWADDPTNITQQVVQLYDATYPVKTSASSPPTPARSTTPTTPKPSAASKP
jgi:outer membrane protein